MRRYIVAASTAILLAAGMAGADWIRTLETKRLTADTVIIGDDAPTSAPAIGDLQVQGALTISGAQTFTGAATFNGNVTLGDAATDSVTATAYFTRLRAGTGSTPDVTFGNDDAFIEDTLEVDGATRLDGAVRLGDAGADAVTVLGTITATPTAEFAGGLTVDSTGFTVSGTTYAIADAATYTSQTLENKQVELSLTTDSTFLTGTNITYSGGRGSSDLNLAGTWSATAGGYSNLYSLVTASGAINDANGGALGMKSVVNTTAAQTAGNITGIQGIARHNHASNKAANAMNYIGVEGVVTQAAAGQIGTAIGVSAAWHVPADAAAFDGGAVFRGAQITLDNASGNNPSESTGLAIWNMAGAQDNAIKIIKSATGFTYDLVLQNGETITNSTDGTVAFDGAITSSATGSLGWHKVNAANQACNTTCTSACVIGMDAGASAFLDCDDATADSCVCAGAS